tara:strand:- start:516 stop:767 length:252 start_codon:yes stop_codon:yes gene_type:complete
MGLDLQVFKEYLIEGKEVESCYMENHSGDERTGFCIDITHKGISNYSEMDWVGLGVSGMMTVMTLYFMLLYFINRYSTRKAYK